MTRSSVLHLATLVLLSIAVVGGCAPMRIYYPVGESCTQSDSTLGWCIGTTDRIDYEVTAYCDYSGELKVTIGLLKRESGALYCAPLQMMVIDSGAGRYPTSYYVVPEPRAERDHLLSFTRDTIRIFLTYSVKPRHRSDTIIVDLGKVTTGAGDIAVDLGRIYVDLGHYRKQGFVDASSSLEDYRGRQAFWHAPNELCMTSRAVPRARRLPPSTMLAMFERTNGQVGRPAAHRKYPTA